MGQPRPSKEKHSEIAHKLVKHLIKEAVTNQVFGRGFHEEDYLRALAVATGISQRDLKTYVRPIIREIEKTTIFVE